MRPVRVLQVTREIAGEQRYGMGRSVGQLSAGLSAIGVEVGHFSAGQLTSRAVAAAATRANRWSGRFGNEFRPLFEVLSRAWETGFNAADAARAGEYTHVHCHDSVVAHGFASASIGRSVAFGTTQHGFDGIAQGINRHLMRVREDITRAVEWMERDVMRLAGWTICLTQRGSNRLCRDLCLDWRPRSLHVVPHGTPVWPQMSRNTARRLLGWSDDERVLLAVGQIIPLKRLDWIVRAFGRAPAGWRLVVLGEGDADGLVSLAESCGIPCPTVRATDAPQVYYAAADALASASATESFGMALLEAMTCGLPLACTSVGGVPDVVGEAALLLPDDETGFARGLEHFLSESAADFRAALARKALDRIRQWPSVEGVATRHLEIYTRAESSSPIPALDPPFPDA